MRRLLWAALKRLRRFWRFELSIWLFTERCSVVTTGSRTKLKEWLLCASLVDTLRCARATLVHRSSLFLSHLNAVKRFSSKIRIIIDDSDDCPVDKIAKPQVSAGRALVQMTRAILLITFIIRKKTIRHALRRFALGLVVGSSVLFW